MLHLMADADVSMNTVILLKLHVFCYVWLFQQQLR